MYFYIWNITQEVTHKVHQRHCHHVTTLSHLYIKKMCTTVPLSTDVKSRGWSSFTTILTLKIFYCCCTKKALLSDVLFFWQGYVANLPLLVSQDTKNRVISTQVQLSPLQFHSENLKMFANKHARLV